MDNNDGNLSNGGVLLVKSETEHRAQATTKPENGTHIVYPQAISKVSRGVILVSLWGGHTGSCYFVAQAGIEPVSFRL